MSLFVDGLLVLKPKPAGFNSSGAMYLTVPVEGEVVLPGSTVFGSVMIVMNP